MKTNTNKSESGLKSRSEQLSTKKLPRISWKRRFANRALATEKLLALLRSEAPRFFELAEVIGKWVWIQFDSKQPSAITRELAELGFHWNNNRQSWQHPCGTIPNMRADFDPRQRYGSYFAADRIAT
jgi:hypothetical protein